MSRWDNGTVWSGPTHGADDPHTMWATAQRNTWTCPQVVSAGQHIVPCAYAWGHPGACQPNHHNERGRR